MHFVAVLTSKSKVNLYEHQGRIKTFGALADIDGRLVVFKKKDCKKALFGTLEMSYGHSRDFILPKNHFERRRGRGGLSWELPFSLSDTVGEVS